MKRGTDHCWNIIQYKDNESYYAKCRCGFVYECSISKMNEDGEYTGQQITKLFPYCPHCGARKKYYDDEVKRVDYSFAERRPRL